MNIQEISKLSHVIDDQEVKVSVGYNILDYLIQDIADTYIGKKLFFVISTPVASIIKPYVENILDARGIDYHINFLSGDEDSKSFSNLSALCENILYHRPSRQDVIISCGGGAVGDLCGLAASILLRGMKLIHIPTTILAQADSSIGGKTAINSKYGKNLIGSFYLAEHIYCDIGFFASLNERDYQSGYAEILKYALIFDKDFYIYLLNNSDNFHKRDQEYLKYLIVKSISYKAEIVKQDLRDHGARQLLNFGHTFAHSLEAFCSFSRILLHGEAVAIGMSLAAEYSANLGYITTEDVDILKHHLHKIGLPCALSDVRNDWDAEKLFNLMLQDKKNIGDNLRLILLKKIGKAYIDDNIDKVSVLEFLKRKI